MIEQITSQTVNQQSKWIPLIVFFLGVFKYAYTLYLMYSMCQTSQRAKILDSVLFKKRHSTTDKEQENKLLIILNSQ